MHALLQGRPLQHRGSDVPVRTRILGLLLNWLVFSMCYPLANLLAQQGGVTRSLAIDFDSAVPFQPWMVLPYATSGLFFTLVFFLVPTPEALRVVSRRLLLITTAGTLVFVVFPARFSQVRPAVVDALPASFFRWLDLVDLPYNQFPSLHVAYCLIFWLALRPVFKAGARVMLAAWLLLVGASTVLTWQHHLADVAGGLLLAALAAHLIRPGATGRHTVTFYYTIMAGLLIIAAAASPGNWFPAYVAASLLLVASGYYLRSGGFLLKQSGRHPLLAWLLFWPYLAGYWLTWTLVRMRERGRPAFTEHAPGVYVGRRLTAAESAQLPPGCQIIDLSAELPEAAALCGKGYRHFPLLDLQAPRPGQLRPVISTIAQLREQGLPVYIHCAMGYSRSRLVARIYLRKCRQCRSRSIS